MSGQTIDTCEWMDGFPPGPRLVERAGENVIPEWLGRFLEARAESAVKEVENLRWALVVARDQHRADVKALRQRLPHPNAIESFRPRQSASSAPSIEGGSNG